VIDLFCFAQGLRALWEDIASRGKKRGPACQPFAFGRTQHGGIPFSTSFRDSFCLSRPTSQSRPQSVQNVGISIVPADWVIKTVERLCDPKSFSDWPFDSVVSVGTFFTFKQLKGSRNAIRTTHYTSG
jgi:hypothetical protein